MKRLIIILTILWICDYKIQPLHSATVEVVTLNPWTLKNKDETKDITVTNLKAPTGVYTALKQNYGDVLNSKNDEELRWIANDSWIFSTSFNVAFENVQKINLTFHGIDTVATIRLNNEIIGKTDNMFTRYSFDVLPYLQAKNNLEIEFKSPLLAAKEMADELKKNGINTPPDCPHERENGECHRNMLRKMQMSFGGDWNLAAPSMGLWKSVDLEYYEVAIMRDVDVAMRHNDTHWVLDIKVFLSCTQGTHFYGELTFIAAELLNEPLIIGRKLILYTSPKLEFKVEIPKEKISLWWPNGYGNQKLYPLFFSMNAWIDGSSSPKLKAKSVSKKTIKIGFRTIELDEDLDDFGRNFHFKVNDHPIFIKGANYIPSHILPELSYDESRVEHLIKSAKESHLNMIRVWGGGLYESDIFYELADYYGILIWQDLAFSSATYPLTDAFVDSVRIETAQNAKRLAYHPSLCMLVTNNKIELYLTKNKTEFGSDSQRLEEEYKQLFMGTIRHELSIISRNDFNPRAGPMISTPSMGVEESKKDLSTDPQNPNYGDVHFWEDDKDGWDPSIYPRARFVTEYGFQSLPILASWHRTMTANDNLAEIVRHRQHDPKGFGPMIQLISRHFSFPLLDWGDDIDKLIYFSQISQAMATKTATDVFRSQRSYKRTMGAMYWQLNDAWVAPTWSSIDYFGNYKMLWYWSKLFMAPKAIIALIDSKTDRINLTVTIEESVADLSESDTFNITMDTYFWSKLYSSREVRWNNISVTPHGLWSDSIIMSSIFHGEFSRLNSFLEFKLWKNNEVLSKTYVFPGKLANAMELGDPELNIDLVTAGCTDQPSCIYYSLTITIARPALFIYLEVYHTDVERYKFSDNGFIQTEPVNVIKLQIEPKKSVKLKVENIRIFTVNQYKTNTATALGSSTVTSTTESISVENHHTLESDDDLQMK